MARGGQLSSLSLRVPPRPDRLCIEPWAGGRLSPSRQGCQHSARRLRRLRRLPCPCAVGNALCTKGQRQPAGPFNLSFAALVQQYCQSECMGKERVTTRWTYLAPPSLLCAIPAAYTRQLLAAISGSTAAARRGGGTFRLRIRFLSRFKPRLHHSSAGVNSSSSCSAVSLPGMHACPPLAPARIQCLATLCLPPATGLHKYCRATV